MNEPKKNKKTGQKVSEDDIKLAILDFFRRNSGKYVSGEDISRALGVSRAYVWKHINKLRDDGYGIPAVPHLGYKLNSSPDRLSGYEIRAGLKTVTIGKKAVYHYGSVGSTNDIAYLLAEKGEPEGVIVIAESQTRGKGRLGRKWVSPKGGGVYMSLILRPDIEADEIPAITLIAAKSVAKAINRVSGLEPGIKWPNDILVNGRKICGILTEIKAQPDRVDFLVLGIGVNVNTPGGDLPCEGTSIKNETGCCVDRVMFVRNMLEEFEDDYNRLVKYGFSSLREDCKKLSLLLSRKIKITEHNRVITGTAVDIDDKGALIVKDGKGMLHRVFSGDIVLAGEGI